MPQQLIDEKEKGFCPVIIIYSQPFQVTNGMLPNSAPPFFVAKWHHYKIRRIHQLDKKKDTAGTSNTCGSWLFMVATATIHRGMKDHESYGCLSKSHGSQTKSIQLAQAWLGNPNAWWKPHTQSKNSCSYFHLQHGTNKWPIWCRPPGIWSGRLAAPILEYARDLQTVRHPAKGMLLPHIWINYNLNWTLIYGFCIF